MDAVTTPSTLASGNDDVIIAKYERDITLIIAAAIGSTVIAAVTIACLGCLYYYRCIKFARIVHPNDSEDETEKKASATADVKTSQLSTSPARVSTITEQMDEHDTDEARTFGSKTPLSMFTGGMTTPDRIRTVYEQMNTYDMDVDQMFTVNSEKHKLYRMVMPPDRVLPLYDEGEMADFYDEMDNIYGSLTVEHEDYILRTSEIRLAYYQRWKRGITKSKRKRNHSFTSSNIILPKLKTANIKISHNEARNKIAPVVTEDKYETGKKRNMGFLEMIVQDIAEQEEINENQWKKPERQIDVSNADDMHTEQNAETENHFKEAEPPTDGTNVYAKYTEQQYAISKDIPIESNRQADVINIDSNLNAQDFKLFDDDTIETSDIEEYYDGDDHIESADTVAGTDGDDHIESTNTVAANDGDEVNSSIIDGSSIRDGSASRFSHVMDGFVALKEIDLDEMTDS